MASTEFDLAGFRKGIEARDAGPIAAAYDENARLTVVDRDHPPSTPQVIRGRADIEKFWRGVCEREMSHRVEQPVASGDRVSFVEHCAYPDGCHVMASQTLDLKNGKIVDHLMVQAWDA
jgi:hypothetical protein